MPRSIEERVEDWAKNRLRSHGIQLYYKTDRINDAIEHALTSAPSKSGGPGANTPDIKFLVTHGGRDIPVMIEVKGTAGHLVKLNKDNKIANMTQKGTPAYANIENYAVNGAVHYAQAILEYSGEEYPSCIAVGVNGYVDSGEEIFETQIYYLSKANFGVSKRFKNDSLSVFWSRQELALCIEHCTLTDAEREALTRSAEDEMDRKLKDLNQYMRNGTSDRDKQGRYGLNLGVQARVPLVCGMLMAGLGVDSEGVEPLAIADLRGNNPKFKNSDGHILLRHIEAFLTAKRLPSSKRSVVLNILRPIFLNSSLVNKGDRSETVLKSLYRAVLKDIVPYFDTQRIGYLDFTGKLFNVLTEWVDIPDGGENDVVLTPRYVTDMMARLCEVTRNDYVWDYALGTAGFLVSSMRLMLADAQKIDDVEERMLAEADIRANHLIGIEKRDDIYMLAVLNMVLMGDGSANIICGNSLEWDGTYQQGKHEGEKFPATVFLLNPPYSAPGKGFVFVKRALSRMSKGGRAAILIFESAGSGQGLPYTAEILKENTLKASIHMADIFKNRANVRTAVYVFECGIPHDPKKEVIFVDMDEDGFTRQNRKRASSATNLKNTDHAPERYSEVVDIVLGRKKSTDFYKDGEHVFRDCIGLDGDDWTVQIHRKFDTRPTIEDFQTVVSDYLSWRVASILESNDV